MFAGYTHKRDGSYHFTFSDVYCASRYHPNGLFHFSQVSFEIQCQSNQDEPVFVNLEVNGTNIKQSRDTAAILMLLNAACTHTATHNYCNSIAKHAQSGMPEYLVQSSIIQNMIAASSGLNVAANW